MYSSAASGLRLGRVRSLVIGPRERQSNDQLAALPGPSLFTCTIPTMERDEVFDNRQANAETLVSLLGGELGLREKIDPRHQIGRNADTVVHHLDDALLPSTVSLTQIMPPRGVYLVAFSIRLTKTWWSRPSSASTSTGESGSSSCRCHRDVLQVPRTRAERYGGNPSDPAASGWLHLSGMQACLIHQIIDKPPHVLHGPLDAPEGGRTVLRARFAQLGEFGR